MTMRLAHVVNEPVDEGWYVFSHAGIAAAILALSMRHERLFARNWQTVLQMAVEAQA
jgi:hypothetical protein